MKYHSQEQAFRPRIGQRKSEDNIEIGSANIPGDNYELFGGKIPPPLITGSAAGTQTTKNKRNS
jgi:hypothetical protein